MGLNVQENYWGNSGEVPRGKLGEAGRAVSLKSRASLLEGGKRRLRDRENVLGPWGFRQSHPRVWCLPAVLLLAGGAPEKHGWSPGKGEMGCRADFGTSD